MTFSDVEMAFLSNAQESFQALSQYLAFQYVLKEIFSFSSGSQQGEDQSEKLFAATGARRQETFLEIQQI